ncbi:glycosyltransferase family A protein [Bacillus pseudomycoides]|uniref:Glycosyltransferase family A protein n=1 Tax=Bacillus bingmayongensis TaxID=1150157 RepID=A0ABU5K4P5_9BACI|nr:glycosyltransferase family A protein [Bacillus pseudomycoides]
MVSIICCTMRDQQMENIFQNYDNQTWRERELIVILNRNEMDVRKWEMRAKLLQNVSIYKLPEYVTLGECLNFGIKKAKSEIIAKFDDDDYYSPNYLASTVQTLNTTNIDLIGKRTVYMYFEDEKILAIHKPGKENKFVNQGLKGATLLFKKEISKKVCFPNLNLGEDTYFIRQCISNNLKVYSSDRFNYVCVRKSLESHHTWQINNQYLMKKSIILCETDNYKPLISSR